MDVSIIIVNYNTTKLVVDCLKSIKQHTSGVRYEVVIVDNNTDSEIDDTIRKEYGDEENLKFLKLPENLGFGMANNRGIEIAEGRNIFFLNPDTILLNNAVKILSDYLDNHNDCGGCGGSLFDENMQPTSTFRRMLPGLWWEIDELLNMIPSKLLWGKDIYNTERTSAFKVGFIVGADLMVKKQVVDDIGGFSEEFFMYFEETDLCARIHKIGMTVICVPSARIQHLEGKSMAVTSEINPFKIRNMERSRCRYIRRNCCHMEAITANLVYKLFLKSRILLVRNGYKKKLFKMRLAIMSDECRKDSYNKSLK